MKFELIHQPRSGMAADRPPIDAEPAEPAEPDPMARLEAAALRTETDFAATAGQLESAVAELSALVANREPDSRQRPPGNFRPDRFSSSTADAIEERS
ncbi:hypothetical protein DPM19_14595 [Actinomadura craniellae]|uniref:Uncharacterized protein n=1 Tax=Actinomadura craniellae TaxID=2231787 RepID=A0A365H580_9ACTN|nr:hypothetical protein [Actinomadura craniellae]RAY14209.1 hypothetical protein DPM19_14595 [Actinomadura craniellae]